MYGQPLRYSTAWLLGFMLMGVLFKHCVCYVNTFSCIWIKKWNIWQEKEMLLPNKCKCRSNAAFELLNYVNYLIKMNRILLSWVWIVLQRTPVSMTLYFAYWQACTDSVYTFSNAAVFLCLLYTFMYIPLFYCNIAKYMQVMSIFFQVLCASCNSFPNVFLNTYTTANAMPVTLRSPSLTCWS